MSSFIIHYPYNNYCSDTLLLKSTALLFMASLVTKDLKKKHLSLLKCSWVVWFQTKKLILTWQVIQTF